MRPARLYRKVGGAFLLVALAVVTLADTGGCENATGANGVAPFDFSAVPDTVAPGDTIQVIFTLRNPTSDTVTITSTMGCLFHLETLRAEEQMTLKGALYLCSHEARTFRVPPGDSLHIVHEVIAAVRNAEAPYEWVPAPRGTYRIRTQMCADLPELETTVVVVE